jgi:hypothetical protein
LYERLRPECALAEDVVHFSFNGTIANTDETPNVLRVVRHQLVSEFKDVHGTDNNFEAPTTFCRVASGDG